MVWLRETNHLGGQLIKRYAAVGVEQEATFIPRLMCILTISPPVLSLTPLFIFVAKALTKPTIKKLYSHNK